VVHTGDPLILAVNKVEPSEAQLKMGRKASWRDASVTWEHHDDGVVTDVFQDSKGAQVVVKTRQELREADKISGRYGNKGVIAKIIPDSEMPTLEDGTKPELLISTLAITSRVNPAQIVECILGKIAAKTGKRYAVKDFDKIDDLVQFAIDEAKKYGIKDCEDLIDDSDPDHPKKIPHVLSGTSFWMKLHHTSESKAQGRGIGRYTMDGQPAKGGDDGAKRMGMLELSALLSHGATNNIADIKYVKGQENLDYWRQYMAGYNPPTPRVPYVYDKFVNYLKGAGINVVRDNSHINIMALTAKDVDDLTGNREIVGVPDRRTGLRRQARQHQETQRYSKEQRSDTCRNGARVAAARRHDNVSACRCIKAFTDTRQYQSDRKHNFHRGRARGDRQIVKMK
jgi:DNA-directed RNA polymerase beta subunit